MEASALTQASQRGLLARRSPLLKLQGDERLIAMARSGNAGAFETIVDRYQGRLLGFCRQMLGSTEDAEDVLQEVFVNAYRAMLADEREINLRPWLYRIARNRCLNHLRKPTADASESMDLVPGVEAASTAERVHNREEFRQLLADVGKLPETQRSALVLREIDAMSYEEIALTMDTSVPSVKSLLVRARISLAESSQARQLTCGEVQLELAEAAEGLRKASGPVRRHVRDCEQCAAFRAEVRANDKALAAALSPVGPLLALKGFLASKLGFGGGASSGAGAAAGAGAGGTGAGAGSVGAAIGGSGAAGGLGAVGGALGTKAVAGVVTAAVITAGAAGAVAVQKHEETRPAAQPAAISRSVAGHGTTAGIAPARPAPKPAPRHTATQPTAVPPPAETVPPTGAPEAAPPTTEAPAEQSSAGGPSSGDEGTGKASAPGVTGANAQPGTAEASGGTVVVAVGSPASPPPPAEGEPPAEGPPPAPPASEPPAAEEPAPEPEAPAPSGE